jgi:hypothetical protein
MHDHTTDNLAAFDGQQAAPALVKTNHWRYLERTPTTWKDTTTMIVSPRAAVTTDGPFKDRVIGRLNKPFWADAELRTERSAGATRGYASLDQATRALQKATAGNNPAVALFQQDGRFFAQKVSFLNPLGPVDGWLHLTEQNATRVHLDPAAGPLVGVLDGTIFVQRS